MIYTEMLPLPPVDRREVLRYAGTRQETPALMTLLEEAQREAAAVLCGSVCWGEFPVTRQGTVLDLGFARTDSAALARNLSGCDHILLFAATVGLGLDRLILRYGTVSPAKALLLQALGTERIEALCDCFCQKRQAETGIAQSPRFSPGYGDLPLELQTHIFRALDCSRRIGLTLNGSLLMSPSKSVTAILGLKNSAHTSLR